MDTTETTVAIPDASAPAPSAPRDLTAIVEAKLAGAAAEPPPATEAQPTPPPAPADAPKKPSATEVYERALKMERKAAADRAALKSEQQQVAEARAALDKEREELTKGVAADRELVRLVKDDPREFLRRAGVSFDEFAKRLSAGHRVDPETRERLDKLERETTEREKRAAAEREQATKAEAERAQQVRAQVVEEFGRAVKADAQKWGATAHYLSTTPEEAIGLLEMAVNAHHSETGRIPSNEEAADRIERMIVEDTIARLSSSATLKARARELLAAEDKAAAKPAIDTNKPARQASKGDPASADGPRTLTQNHATSGGVGERRLTPDERFERMVAKVEAARAAKG